ncbi:MAG: hypothetical protein ACRDH9_08175 [Actinomycetota bacterium]
MTRSRPSETIPTFEPRGNTVPKLDRALRDLSSKAAELSEAAEKYGKVRKAQDRAHEKTVEAYEEWRDETPPSEATMQRLRKAQAKENSAIHDSNVAEDALRAAASAFSTALAEFFSAVSQATSH